MTVNEKRRTRRGEHGETMTQTVIIAPVLFTLIMTIIQFALFAHAQNVAEAAAQEGVAAARQFGSTESAGTAKASDALASLGPKMLTEHAVNVNRSATTVTVTVTGQVLSLVPGYHPHISQTASGPVERYVAPKRNEP